MRAGMGWWDALHPEHSGAEHPSPPQNHLLVLLLLVLEAVVYRRQEYYRKQHQLLVPITETIFEDVSREQLDHGLVNCVKYFLNYFYYKFGLEVGSGGYGATWGTWYVWS